MTRTTTGSLLAAAWRAIRAGGAPLLGVILLTQLVVLLVAIPVLGWLFREALRAGGMSGLDLGSFTVGSGLPVTIALLLLVMLLAFWLMTFQFTLIVVLIAWPGLTARQYLAQLGRITRKLLRPQSVPLVLYLFFVLPLTGFGFTSAFTNGIVIPPFISGELEKSPTTAIVYSLFLVVLALVNLRLALTVPLFVLTDDSRPVRDSWRLTRGFRVTIPLVIAVAAVLFLALIVTIPVILLALIPTAISDSIAPEAAPVIAAYSLGITQVAGFLVVGLTTAGLAGVLIAQLQRSADRLLPHVALLDRPIPGRRAVSPKALRIGVVAAAGVMALGFGTAAISTMDQLSRAPDTLVLAHRGFTEGGVENTLSALEAAAGAGADLVEMDVMQTADGQFVVMHDAALGRLADRPDAIADLTLAELTEITVHDEFGHQDTIPALADYVTRAAELELPLLIEIKLGGADTADHVDRLVAELESLNALDSNIYHSLDAASVTRLKQLRPDLTVGYIMPVAGGGIPDTRADFIVVEEWTASDAMQKAANQADLGFMVWTVNTEESMRNHLRSNVDGMITDHPDLLRDNRDEMHTEVGLSAVLIDAIFRFVPFV